jgi:hypothetical protein
MNPFKISRLGTFLAIVYILIIVLAFVGKSYIAYAIFITSLSPFFKLNLISSILGYIVASIIVLAVIYFIGFALGKIHTPGSFKLSAPKE